MTQVDQERVDSVVSSVFDKIRESIVEHRVTYDEYAAAKNFCIELGEAGEWPLLGDVFFESTVEQIDSEEREGTDSTIEGPYYIPGAPMLDKPAVMPMRAEEPGDSLIFSGMVKSADGTPLPGAVIDMWHSANDGTYSDIPYPDDRELPPSGNLRGKFTTDEDGEFEVRTIIPVPYEIPKDGPVGKLLRGAGWHAYRPAHLHCKISAEWYQTQTVQLYFQNDQFLDSDVASAVKPSLVLTLDKPSEPAKSKWQLDGPYYTTSYEFRLARA